MLPEASVAVQIMVVSPTSNMDGASFVMVTEPELSVAVALPIDTSIGF